MSVPGHSDPTPTAPTPEHPTATKVATGEDTVRRLTTPGTPELDLPRSHPPTAR